MRAHEPARRQLVGRVFLGQAIPQRSGAQHVQVSPTQAAARLERPVLVQVVREEVAEIQIRRRTAESLIARIQPSLPLFLFSFFAPRMAS